MSVKPNRGDTTLPGKPNSKDIQIQKEYVALQMSILEKVLQKKRQEFSALQKKEMQAELKTLIKDTIHPDKKATAATSASPRANSRSLNRRIDSPGPTPTQELIRKLKASAKKPAKTLVGKELVHRHEPPPLLMVDSNINRSVKTYESAKKAPGQKRKASVPQKQRCGGNQHKSNNNPSAQRHKHSVDSAKSPVVVAGTKSLERKASSKGRLKEATQKAPSAKRLKLDQVLERFNNAIDSYDQARRKNFISKSDKMQANTSKEARIQDAIKKDILHEIHQMKKRSYGSPRDIDNNEMKIRTIAKLCMQRSQMYNKSRPQANQT